MKDILLVEDDPLELDLTLSAVRESGMSPRTFVVRDGDEAMDYLMRRNKFQMRDGGLPRCILLDLRLKTTDGFSVLEQVRASSIVRHIPVVVLTSSTDMEDARECYRRGANSFIAKPVDHREYVAKVKATLEYWLAVNLPVA